MVTCMHKDNFFYGIRKVSIAYVAVIVILKIIYSTSSSPCHPGNRRTLVTEKHFGCFYTFFAISSLNPFHVERLFMLKGLKSIMTCIGGGCNIPHFPHRDIVFYFK